MYAHPQEPVPGLLLFSDAISPAECLRLQQAAMALYPLLEASSAEAQRFRTNIPQPDFVADGDIANRLASEEEFARVEFMDDNRGKRCEYFSSYGEPGHALAYFRGNNNLPEFILEPTLTNIRAMLVRSGLASADDSLRWRLTVNFYKRVADTVAGFPFHVDIPANGIVTMILNVHHPATFQIAKDDRQENIELPVGALLLLSGEARYEWKHRVLPQTTESERSLGRVSLVLGFIK